MRRRTDRTVRTRRSGSWKTSQNTAIPLRLSRELQAGNVFGGTNSKAWTRATNSTLITSISRYDEQVSLIRSRTTPTVEGSTPNTMSSLKRLARCARQGRCEHVAISLTDYERPTTFTGLLDKIALGAGRRVIQPARLGPSSECPTHLTNLLKRVQRANKQESQLVTWRCRQYHRGRDDRGQHSRFSYLPFSARRLASHRFVFGRHILAADATNFSGCVSPHT